MEVKFGSKFQEGVICGVTYRYMWLTCLIVTEFNIV